MNFLLSLEYGVYVYKADRKRLEAKKIFIFWRRLDRSKNKQRVAERNEGTKVAMIERKTNH